MFVIFILDEKSEGRRYLAKQVIRCYVLLFVTVLSVLDNHFKIFFYFCLQTVVEKMIKWSLLANSNCSRFTVNQ